MSHILIGYIFLLGGYAVEGQVAQRANAVSTTTARLPAFYDLSLPWHTVSILRVALTAPTLQPPNAPQITRLRASEGTLLV